MPILEHHFGPETKHFFAESGLNRLSFLRSQDSFLDAALKHESARFILIKDHEPLICNHTPTNDGAAKRELHTLCYNRIKHLVGEPYKTENLPRGSKHVHLVFLGIHESDNGTDFSYKSYRGVPYFALDLSTEPSVRQPQLQNAIDSLCNELVSSQGGMFVGLVREPNLIRSHYAMFAEACHTLDWVRRTKFCAGCGRPTLAKDGGWRLACTAPDSEACETQGKISNLCYPRTDVVMIVAVINHDGSKVLLGRSKRMPPGLYTCLAGFLEPGESVEECVRREVYEESGVLVGRVVLHSSQPWPYPANLMIGCIAQAGESSSEIFLGNDPELEDAKWVSLEELKTLSSAELFGSESFIPGEQAVAGVLLRAVLNGSFWRRLPSL